jgi:hypothetical protein
MKPVGMGPSQRLPVAWRTRADESVVMIGSIPRTTSLEPDIKPNRWKDPGKSPGLSR